jgi:ornithine cyclodeaminase/alanine dehydrogenase-like protein (mu-crystallin family)
MALLISEEDVRTLLTPEDTLEALEDAYDQYGRGLVRNPIRREMRTSNLKGGDLPQEDEGDQGISMNFAYADKYKMAIVKVMTKFNNMKLLTHLIDTQSGKTLAIFHSTWESYMRVGAEAAIGTKYFARKDASTLGVLGVGAVGRLVLAFNLLVRKFDKVYCHAGRAEDSALAKKYAKEMEKKHGIQVIPVEEVEKLVKASDIVVSATRAKSPIVKAEWIKPGTHITGIGADSPQKAEYEPEVFGKMDKIVIDYGLALETLQMKRAFERGSISQKDIYGNIGEVVAGIKPGREKDSEITGYILTGMTVGYVVILERIYRKAIKQGRGINTKDLTLPSPLFDSLFLTEESQ